ncbi:MAG TPA: glycosyltransferase family 2 protein [Acidimicrobiia bacterium]|jgi:glycosyltransferase involved in cell wall biosynthesis
MLADGHDLSRRVGATRESALAHVRVSVVVPALNEAKNLPHVFARIPPDVYEVILVDGGSTDETPIVARQLRDDVRVLEQPGRGKGNALLHGFHACQGDIVVALDADGSTDPAEIPAFVAALLAGADFAKGSRFAAGAGSSDITPIRWRGNRLLLRVVNTLFGTRYTDLCYGYNAFWSRYVAALTPDPPSNPRTSRMVLGDGFEIETLINVRIAKLGLRVVEVPSFEGERIHGASRLNAARDGCRAVRAIALEWGPTRRSVRTAWPDGAHAFDDCVEHGAWDCCCPVEVGA